MTHQKDKTVTAGLIIGYLGHDNKYFDATCPQCHGMYSSHLQLSCPKCGRRLVSLTYLDKDSGKRVPLTISEGTIYPAYCPSQERKTEEATKARRGGVLPTYRFKLFGFGDEHGRRFAPKGHEFCKTSKMVELKVINHPPIVTVFNRENGVGVELMYHIFTNYGDSIRLLSQEEVQASTVSEPTDAQGNPKPIHWNEQTAAAKQQEIDELKRRVVALEGNNTMGAGASTELVEVVERDDLAAELVEITDATYPGDDYIEEDSVDPWPL